MHCIRDLPKKTDSLCPECKKIIPATIFESDGKVLMEKDLPRARKGHRYLLVRRRACTSRRRSSPMMGSGVTNPAIPNAKVCPNECGLCQTSSEPHLAGQRRPDQPLQPEMPHLLRQRQPGGLCRSSPSFEQITQDAGEPQGPAAGPDPGRPVLRRRADHLSASSSM